jgi:hypothetical protein
LYNTNYLKNPPVDFNVWTNICIKFAINISRHYI